MAQQTQQRRDNYAFIDSQNLNVGVQKFGWKMDWAKFRKFLADKYSVEKAYMFIGYVPEFEEMYEQLHNVGYLIVLKPTFDMTKPRTENQESRIKNQEDKKTGDKEEERHVKGNIDADLVLWAMKEMSNYKKAVLVSGDGDFYTLAEYLEGKNRLEKILAPNAHYSGLFNKFDKYVERLDVHRKELAYRDSKDRPRNAQRNRRGKRN